MSVHDLKPHVRHLGALGCISHIGHMSMVGVSRGVGGRMDNHWVMLVCFDRRSSRVPVACGHIWSHLLRSSDMDR